MLPKPNTIMGNLAFVGCSSRLGTVTRPGPVTGELLTITVLGRWIDEQDAEILCESREGVWCFRTQNLIDIHTIFYLDPSKEQIKRRFPLWGTEVKKN